MQGNVKECPGTLLTCRRGLWRLVQLHVVVKRFLAPSVDQLRRGVPERIRLPKAARPIRGSVCPKQLSHNGHIGTRECLLDAQRRRQANHARAQHAHAAAFTRGGDGSAGDGPPPPLPLSTLDCGSAAAGGLITHGPPQPLQLDHCCRHSGVLPCDFEGGAGCPAYAGSTSSHPDALSNMIRTNCCPDSIMRFIATAFASWTCAPNATEAL